MIPKGNYPNTFYRVSIKAVIRNTKGEVLLVKEEGGSWSLPGGGMDHGETPEQALAREMIEEAEIRQPFSAICLGVGPRFVVDRNAWLLWVVYELSFDAPLVFSKGVDADEVAFMDPMQFHKSDITSEKLVYKWCVDRRKLVDGL
jgi:ADP-ribose pyrophosphatase YjhB (NUDIX family)